MQWYLAKLVFHILSGNGDHTPQFDEQLRLISAEDYLHAFQKARLMGERETECFLNRSLQPVHWKFIDISELFILEELLDGAEIYSKISEQDDADNYIRSTQKRALHLLNMGIHQFAKLN